jgi:GPH family glycoside/pentoside/hexuronide:cation symporter
MAQSELLPKDTAPRLSVRTLLGYGVGQAGAQVFRDLPTFLLPAFLTTALGVSPWLMGLAIFLPKLWIFAFDPIVGAWSDRVRTRLGRRRPFLLAGALFSPVTLPLVFGSPIFAQEWQTAAFTSLAFLLAMTGFSLFSVPYLALGAEMSQDPHQRSKLMAYRLAFIAIGVFANTGVSLRLVAGLGGGAHGYWLTSIIMGMACGAAMLVCFFGTAGTREDHDAPVQTALPWSEKMRIVGRNKPFLLLLLMHFIHLVAQSAIQGTTLIFFLYIVHNPALLLGTSLVNGLTIIASQPLWLAISRRWGKKRSIMGGLILYIANLTTWALIGPSGAPVAHVPFLGPISPGDIAILIRYMILGVAFSGITLMAYSLFTDAVNGKGADSGNFGIFSGIWSSAEKISYATGPLIAGLVLSSTGFLSSQSGVVPQSHGALTGILVAFVAIPCFLNLITIPLILMLPLGSHRSAP